MLPVEGILYTFKLPQLKGTTLPVAETIEPVVVQVTGNG